MAKLTQRAALNLAVKIWGRKKAAVCDTKRATSVADRAAAARELRALNEVRPTVLSVRQVDPAMSVGDFLALEKASREAVLAWKVKADAASARLRSYRYQVGQSTWAFCIEGQGDTWEAAFAAAGYRLDGSRMSEEERAHQREVERAELVAAGYVSPVVKPAPAAADA